MNNRIVFTGGPGSGKTSVIEFLNSLGYPNTKEVGRKVIKKQINSHGTALPWEDRTAFRDEMVLEEINNYTNFEASTITFYDRSIIDSYGYSKLEKIPISNHLLSKCYELVYNKKVFIFPPWEAIYKNDEQRKQDFPKAIETYNQMVKAYKKFGYELIEVPRVSIEARVEFILNNINQKTIKG